MGDFVRDGVYLSRPRTIAWPRKRTWLGANGRCRSGDGGHGAETIQSCGTAGRVYRARDHDPGPGFEERFSQNGWRLDMMKRFRRFYKAREQRNWGIGRWHTALSGGTECWWRV